MDTAQAPMPNKKPSPAMDFVLAELRKNPDVAYAAVRDLAAAKGMQVYPIVYGRAKALLGLVPVAPRKRKKRAAAVASEPVPAKRRPRTPPAREGSPIDSLQRMIDAMRDLEAERDAYKEACQKIVKILAEL
jgi:hypothetical protein